MFYDKFKSLCDQKGISCNLASKEIGLSNSTPTKWKNTGATPESSTLKRVADYFGVTVSSLLDDANDGPMVKCPDCGLFYDSSEQESFEIHRDRHKRWATAVEKFGFCWTDIYREEVKSEARNAINYGNLSTSEYVENQTTVFKALYSRSLEACDYDLRHVDFPTYVSMLLFQNFWKKKIREDAFSEFESKYGTRPGIPYGTYYYIDSLDRFPTREKRNKKSSSITDEAELERVKCLVECFRMLNEEGQEKIMDLADDLLKSGKYKKRNKASLGKKDA